jgi:hypothetical protein
MIKIIIIVAVAFLSCYGDEKQDSVKRDICFTKEEEIIKNESKKIKSAYKKRFGVPISEFEFQTREIIFRIGNPYKGDMGSDVDYLSVRKTPRGAHAEYHPKALDTLLKIDLNTEEWLNFINSLYKLNIHEWKDDDTSYYKDTDADKEWDIEISPLYENKSGWSGNGDAYPPNWHEVMKVMDGMKEKIKLSKLLLCESL